MIACYSSTDKILNHGGLALISPQYFDFAIALTAACDEELNEEKTHERGNKSLQIAKNNIMGDTDIRKKFDNCSCLDEDEMINVKKYHINSVYKTLLKKTVHSRFSFETGQVVKSTMGYFAKGSSKATHRDKLKHLSIAKMKTDGEISQVQVE
uniref:Uncharacterized protein n=1 Tax=Chaetoceros debilis TaxID=122233 RepID=A0A7S3V714_9STRA|mmetsp:Transcript_30167/g.46165  ORF Transcript_30167/g.46165 Transcript_30167/m.46165 type:complete len:153 (+) Transcript_30167:995-1453(+)